jgi:hypothetical protein
MKPYSLLELWLLILFMHQSPSPSSSQQSQPPNSNSHGDTPMPQSEKTRDALALIVESVAEERSSPLKILLSIDEVHVLTKRIPRKDEKKTTVDPIDLDEDIRPLGEKVKLDYLIGAMNELLRDPIFFIVLSTQSDMSFLAPSQEYARSIRQIKSMSHANVPFTEMPFDCHPKIDPTRLELDMLSDSAYMALYGRPLCVLLPYMTF